MNRLRVSGSRSAPGGSFGGRKGSFGGPGGTTQTLAKKTGFPVSEAATVQLPMVRHAEEVGWTPLAPGVALGKRGGADRMLFRDELEGALRRFNGWLTDAAVRSVIETLEALPPTIEGNRETLGWLRGERQWYDEAARRYRPVRLIDFETAGFNVLQVTWEWKIKPPGRKGNRADLMFAVNGVPVAIVEHKNPTDPDAIGRGIRQLRRYQLETPELMGSAQLFNVTHLFDYWYGVTWNPARRFMARWKERPEESYRFAVQSFFEPTDFLRTLRDWIVFYIEDGETRKAVLRQHQRRAAERIVARCAEPSRRRGLIWHTQGSGKTFTLLTAARLIVQGDRFGNPTVVVVVDRRELEGQLAGWVERLLGEVQQQDIPVWRAESKTELRDLLRTDKRGLILSTIHKFEGIEKDASLRENIFVFVDEAHRSVAGDMGNYLMGAVPKATIIGFTGTPIDRTAHGKGTFKIFGADDEQGYLDKYTIAESIEDETTVPIRHTMAPSELTIPLDRLDREFFDLAEEEGVTDIEELNRVLDRAVGLRAFLTADDRVARVAEFVAEHFKETVDPLGFKAFLVGVNREACALYKRALDEHLPPEWSAPVYTKDPDDIVERPLVAKFQLSPEQEAEARSRFRKVGEDPKILIVTDKLLTGFDAPLLYCLYLDKPMRDHVLLQAIARVNRPYAVEGGPHKRIGLVVDFVGVLRELKKALRFDSSDISGVIEDLDLLLQDFRNKIVRAKVAWLQDEGAGGEDERLEKMVYGRFLDPGRRREFFEAFWELRDLWEILSPSAALRDSIDSYRSLSRLYATVQNAYAGRYDYAVELRKKTEELLVREGTVLEGPGSEGHGVDFDLETVEALRGKPGPPERKVFNLLRGLRKEVEEKPEAQAVLVPLRERAERILKDMEDRATSALEALNRLADLAREKQAAAVAHRESGLSPRAFGVRWALGNDPVLRAASIAPAGPGARGGGTARPFPERRGESRRSEAPSRRALSAVAGARRDRAGGDGGAHPLDSHRWRG